MGARTSIEWTDHTFNPWVGCARVSPGCTHCYAEAFDRRTGGVSLGQRQQMDTPELRWGPKARRQRTTERYWKEPLKWDRRARASNRTARVFCASMADVFEDRSDLVPWRSELFALISRTHNLDWLLLTKRPENIARLWPFGIGEFLPTLEEKAGSTSTTTAIGPENWPNVWLGTSVEDQVRADSRVRRLLEVPSAVHFLSCEPLLEPVRLPKVRGLDWVIIGGESGPGARPFNLGWARDLARQATDLGAKVFVKQMGACAEAEEDGRRVFFTGAGGEPSEWPADLRVREFPR